MSSLPAHPGAPSRQSVAEPEHYDASYEPSTTTLVIRGEVDETETGQLREDLRFLSELYPGSLTIDLSDVTFLPSRAVGVIIGAQKAARSRGTELRLRTRPDTISAKVLTIIGLSFETA